MAGLISFGLISQAVFACGMKTQKIKNNYGRDVSFYQQRELNRLLL